MKNWMVNINQSLLGKMIQEKLDDNYKRPTFLDVVAMIVISVSKRSTCLFYNVGAAIFRDNYVLS